MQSDRTALAIHGGAGTIRPEDMVPDRVEAFHAGLRAALLAGHRVLATGGPAIDAVTAAVMALEDDELFNAGRGAVVTSGAEQEMDAAVMAGAGRAGAVAGIRGPRNPVLAARAVMERSDHVLLAGPGALAFCRAQGLVFEDDAYFETAARRAALDAVLAERARGGTVDDFDRHGTVGAVARDRTGALAAATSTGGMTGKMPGRIGDTPVFGAGTWADATCAVSATGHGESFIRMAAAHEISARMRLAGQGLEQAAADVVAEVGRVGGGGGLVAVDRDGRVAMPFNTRGMYRGAIGADGIVRTGIYAEALREHATTEEAIP